MEGTCRMSRGAADADRLAHIERSLGASRASTSKWDGLLTTEDLGDTQEGVERTSAFELDKDALMAQIKHNFHLETHSFRSRILEATDEAARARDRIHDVQNEMLRLRKKCFKLQKMLQERDATIACMQEQHDLQLPMLMHETIRSLHNAVENNQVEADNKADLRSSVHRNRLQQSLIQEQLDERVHEYEKQISRLYEELHQEKQKNEMLRECLKEQKHAKSKLMKACKFARREIEALKESDLSHLLEDLEIKCRELEHRNTALQDDLEFEKTQAINARQERDDIEDELAARRQDSSDWAARLEAKQREIERLRAQIHEQQCALENFQQDYDLVAERTAARPDTNAQSELQQECDLLIRALHRERARVADLEVQIQEQSSTQQRAETASSAGSRGSGSGSAHEVRRQIELVHDKIRRLHTRLAEYTEGEELHLTRRSRNDGGDVDERRLASLVDFNGALDASRASAALSQCGAELDAMQRLMEEAFARALGNNCAMQ